MKADQFEQILVHLVFMYSYSVIAQYDRGTFIASRVPYPNLFIFFTLSYLKMDSSARMYLTYIKLYQNYIVLNTNAMQWYVTDSDIVKDVVCISSKRYILAGL